MRTPAAFVALHSSLTTPDYSPLSAWRSSEREVGDAFAKRVQSMRFYYSSGDAHEMGAQATGESGVDETGAAAAADDDDDIIDLERDLGEDEHINDD